MSQNDQDDAIPLNTDQLITTQIEDVVEPVTVEPLIPPEPPEPLEQPEPLIQTELPVQIEQAELLAIAQSALSTPPATELPPPPPKPMSLPSVLDKETIILVADDSEIAAKLLGKTLRDLGFRAITLVKDGEQTLSTFNLLRPHMVFLDIDMPRVNGLEVLRRMREMDPRALAADFRHTFIVMVSAHSTIDNIKQAVALGANGFIVKPYSTQKIIEAIDKFKKLKGHAPSKLEIIGKLQKKTHQKI